MPCKKVANLLHYNPVRTIEHTIDILRCYSFLIIGSRAVSF